MFDLCNSIETTKDDLVNMAVKEERRSLTEYLLTKTVDILPDLLRLLKPFNHTVNSDSGQLNNLPSRDTRLLK